MTRPPIPIACDRAELVVECAAAAETVALKVAPQLADKPIDVAMRTFREPSIAAVALTTPPTAETLVAFRHATAGRVALCLLGATAQLVDFARDLGITTVDHPKALLGALSLAAAERPKAFSATLRGLSEVDRLRLGDGVRPERGGGLLVRGEGGLIAHRDDSGVEVPIGEPRDARSALRAMMRAFGGGARPSSILEGVDPQAVLDVIRASARALRPREQSGAASLWRSPPPRGALHEPFARCGRGRTHRLPGAHRLGVSRFTRVGLPRLAVDGVDNAARVRDVFRQMMTLAHAREPEARLLGVTVTATSVARALLRIVATPLPKRLVRMEVGFADPHGQAADDRTVTALPAPIGRIESVLARLRGADLVLSGSPTERRATVEAIADVLLRVAAFVDDRREEVVRVEVDPLAVLLGGGAEVREACVTVGDAFLRSLETGATG